MKHNGGAAPPMPHSVEGLKSTRSAAGSQGGNPVTLGGSEVSPSFSLALGTDGNRGENLFDGSSDQTPHNAAASSSVVANTPLVTGSSPTDHRYEQQLLLPHGRSRGSSGGFGKSRDPSMSSYEAPVSLGDVARRASLHRTTTSDSDEAQYPQAELSSSSPHIPTSVCGSVLSSSLAAGARAAGAAVPFLFSLKLPSTTVTHLGVGRASGSGVGHSGDSLNESISSAFGGSSLHSRNPIIGTGEAAVGSEATSPWKPDEVVGAGVDGDHHSHRHQPRRDSGEQTTNATTLFLRDVGPLPASEVCTRNRLPSGTHIRRRPRSVVRRHTGTAGAPSTNGTSSAMIPGDVESAPPAYGALDATISSSSVLAAPHMRQRGASAIPVGGSASGGGVFNRVGTGRTRDVLPPGTRSGTATFGAAATGHRRRADPSPAPSRPPRSHKTRAGVSPSNAAVSGPAFSPTSPAQFGLRANHQSNISFLVPKRMLSEPSSPGASSPLTYSLERGSFSLAGEKDSLAASTSVAANHQHIMSSSNRKGRSARSGVHSGAMTAAAATSTRPPSGRRQGSLARVLAPVHHKAGASHIGEHGASPPMQDYAKLTATYMKLCAEVGNEPNMDWVACLSPAKGGERQHDMLLASMTPSTADSKEHSVHPSKRASSLLNSSLTVPGHFLQSSPQQQQQQQHTPRGGARPRIATGAALLLSATATTLTIPAPPLASSVPQRASTPAARRTKSPGARHGASSLGSPSALPRRSGSVGRITSVSRPSIFGSSTQQQHPSPGGEHNPRAHGVETAMADAYAQQMAKYCTEHLQPFVDNMKAVQAQRAAVTLALQSFVQVASASLAVSDAATEKGGGEEAWRHSVVSLHGYHHSGNSNRGLGSGKDGPASGAIPSTASSSASTTPRKPSISRNSTTSSLANTATAMAGSMSRRASVAAAAAAKAASLSEALQTLQSAVVTLLSTLSDSTALAQVPANGLLSPVKSIDRGSTQPARMASSAIATVTSNSFSPEEGTSGHFDKAPAAKRLLSPLPTSFVGLAEKLIPSAVLTSSDGGSSGVPVGSQLAPTSATVPSGVGADQSAPLPQGVTSAVGVYRSQSQTSAVNSSTTTTAAPNSDAAVSRTVAPSRFVEFVRTQEREVAVQLDEACGAVRHALGSPMTTLEAAITQRSTHNGAGGTTSAPVVCLEVSDMLSTPFFVPPKYLDSLVIAVAGQGGDGATTEEDAAVTIGGDAIVTSTITGACLKTPHALSILKSASSATGKRLQSSKLSSSSSRGGDGVTGRSSENSTPRARPSDTAMPYTPLFTFTTTVDEDEAGDGVVVGEPSVRSISARSTEGAAGNAYIAVERYLLHCVQPAACSPRAGTESGHASSRQNSSLNWTTIDLSASLGNTYGGSAATLNLSTKRATGKSGSKPSARTGAVKSGRAASGGGSIYQSRPALSALQKAPATPRASAGSNKSRKKAPAASQRKTQQERHEQLQQQRRLVKAWTLWTALKPLADNRDGATAAGADEPSSFSPHSSSALASVNASSVAGGRLGDCAVTEEGDAATPPMMSAPTAAGTPVAAIVSVMPKVATPDSVDGAISASRPPLEEGDKEAASAADQLLSPPLPPPPGTFHALGAHSLFEKEKDDDGGLHGELSATHARTSRSTPSMSSLQEVPRRLNMDDTALFTHSDDSAHNAVNAQSSAATFPHSFSMGVSQRTAHPSAVALTHVVATEPHKAAARQIAVWYALMRRRRQALAQHRAAHLTENEMQRQRVLAARRSAFVRLWVCRWRLRRRIDASTSRQQASGLVASTPAEITEDDDLEKTRRAATGKEKAAAATAATAASTSRQRFQRAKEQRKAALASAAAVTSGTARVPPFPSNSSSAAKEAASLAPTRIPPLPLADSGISTFSIRNYHGESSSFTVSAMHRLLNAPPSLLYTTCMVALRYPTNAPMAYLDNSGGSVANHRLDGGEERQMSEVPPATDERFGGVGGSDQLQCSRQSRQTIPGNSCAGGALTARQRRWIETGLLYIRFLDLRHYACGRYEALIPASGTGGLADEVHKSPSGCYGLSSLDFTLTSATCSYRGSTCAAPLATLPVPPTMRYESIVDPNELQHAKPVVKPFHRPFEKWGMAHNLTSRVFCAAAIYAWQLIFSHTPFDDAKQRELPTREEQQARLERVEDRNGIILDCYGVRSEREWLREATKDLSFVGQIYLPHYDRDDPEQQRESRDNYEFVKNFLFQCFPSIEKLADIPDYLVGAGLFFVLKEVFHYTKDSPSTHRMHEALPRLVVMEGQDHIASITPVTSVLAGDGAGVAREGSSSSAVAAIALDLPASATTQLSPAQQLEKKGDSDGVKGLSGWQRAALLRYEQLRQLHHLSYGMAEQEKGAFVDGSRAGAGESLGKATRSKQHRRSRSPAILTTSVSGGDNSSGVPNRASASTTMDDVTLPLRRCIANHPASPLTPMRATPVSTSLSFPLFTSPAALRDGLLENSGAGERRASFTVSAPSRDASVQLVRIPRRLLRPSAAGVQFVRDFEEEVSKSVRGVIRVWNGCGGRTPPDLFDVRVALTAGAAMNDELDIAYPRHFLVRLSETLLYELFGLQVSLSNCEDLDSMGQ